MDFIKQIERIQRTNKLICRESTGNPDALANRLNISRRQVYRIIEFLKENGAPVKYNRLSETFYYENNFELQISFSIKALSENETEKIYGGAVKKQFPCFYMAQKRLIFTSSLQTKSYYY
jgi:predicted DNA-binding transcriptional regulator YafY